MQEKEMAVFGQNPGGLRVASEWKARLQVNAQRANTMDNEERLRHLKLLWPDVSDITESLWAQAGTPIAVKPADFQLHTVDEV